MFGWLGVQAAHVFPLAYQGDWNDHNFFFGHRVTTGGDNKTLLRSNIHQLFNSCFFLRQSRRKNS